MSEPVNPYAPHAAGPVPAVETLAADDPASDRTQVVAASPWRTTVRWTLVCSFSAAPSFVVGYGVTQGQVAGMLLGVVVFIIGYTLLDLNTASLAVRQPPSVRRTLKIAYGTRIAISIVFPVALYLDMICGLVSFSIMGWVFGTSVGQPSMDFVTTFLTTLVQGVVLNIVLAAYALVVHALQLLLLWLLSRHP